MSATTVTNHRTYNSYGKLVSETNTAVDLIFGYTGKQLDDATGLQHNLFRWYDSNLGQWLSEDPMGFDAGDQNLKRYVGNKALSSRDSSGLVEDPPQTPTELDRKIVELEMQLKEYKMLQEHLKNLDDQDIKKVLDMLREQDAKWRRVRPPKPPKLIFPPKIPQSQLPGNTLRPLQPYVPPQNSQPTTLPPFTPPTPSYSTAPPPQTAVQPNWQGLPNGGVQVYDGEL